MNKVKTAAAAAVLSVGAVFSAQASQTQTDTPGFCQGHMYGGDYIVQANPTFAPLSVHDFNIPAGEDLVADVTPIGSGYLITPSDPNIDCDYFMDTLEQNPVVRHIEPNWIMGFDGPGRDIN